MRANGIKIGIVVVFCLLFTALQAKTVVEAYGRLKVVGTNITDSASNPVQLRGMSFFWSQWQGKYYTYNTVKWLRDDWKCTVVRAAMGIQSGGYIANKETEKAKIKAVVEAAIDLGIYVIIDWHSHTASDAAETTESIAFFKEMAQTYGSYPNIIYEPFNEPVDQTWATVKAYHEKVIAAIRDHDTSNIIVCGSPKWDQNVLDPANTPITGYSNIAYSLHYYADTHTQWLRDRAVQAMNKGIALFVTEFGTCDASGGDPINETETKLWFDFLDTYKISWCNWSVADKVEAASIITPDASVDGGWKSNEITRSGNIVRNELLYEYYINNIADTSLPLIFSHPANIALGVGNNTTFSVTALSPDTLKYQWYFNNTIIDGAIQKTYSINAFTESMIGKYFVLVTNSNGTVSSDTANVSAIHRTPYKSVINLPDTIEAENYDTGGNGFTYFDNNATNMGGKYRASEPVDIESSEEVGGFQVGYVATGEWLEYSVSVETAGDYFLDLYTASKDGGGSLQVRFGTYETILFPITKTGNWTKRSVATQTATLEAGEQIVRFTVTNAASGFNIDRLIVTPYDSTRFSAIDNTISTINIYPNPAHDVLTIECNQASTIDIYTLIEKIDTFSTDKPISYSLKNIPTGLFFVRINNASGTTVTKIIKE